jgi:hypothetical protein
MVVENPNFVRAQQTEGVRDSNQGDSQSAPVERKRGKLHSLETRARISEKMAGRKLSPETRAKIGAARIGKKHTPEARAKMSKNRKGKSPGAHTPEHRARISEALKLKGCTKTLSKL